MYQNSWILPEDEDIPIWRYMSFSKFVDLLNSSTLYFSRADRFIDKYEGYVNPYTHDLIDKLFAEFNNADEMRRNLKSLLTNMKQITFVNCWHMNYNETKEMWNAYTLLGEGIAIKSNTKRLAVSIYNNKLGPMHIRPIKYASEIEEEIDLSHALDLLNYKRPEFAFEKELRVLFLYTFGAPETDDWQEYTINAPEYGQSVRINLDALIEAIYVSPESPVWFYELVKNLMKSILDKPVIKSTLQTSVTED